MPHNRIPHRAVALVVRDVGPIVSLAGTSGLVGQRAPDRKDVRRIRNITVADRRRLPGRHLNAVLLQTGHGANRQLILRTCPTECRSIRQPSFGRELVEVRGSYHALGRAVLANKYDRRRPAGGLKRK